MSGRSAEAHTAAARSVPSYRGTGGTHRSARSGVEKAVFLRQEAPEPRRGSYQRARHSLSLKMTSHQIRQGEEKNRTGRSETR